MPAHLTMILELVALSLGLVLWVTIIWRTRRIILERLNNLAVQSARAIASRRLRRISARRMMQIARIGTRLMSVLLLLGGVFVWATLTMEVIPATREAARAVERLFFEKFQSLGLAAASALPDLAIVAFIYFLARVAHEFFNHYFLAIAEEEVESAFFDPVTAATTRRLVDIGIWIVALVVAFPYLPGSNSDAFRGVSVLAGLMLSLGSTNLVGQFTSGLSLIYGRVLRPGDYVETTQGEGVVERIGVVACTLRSPRDEYLSIPHSVVAAGLKNYSRAETGVRFATEVTIGYDNPWRQVRDLLLAAAADTPGIRADPPPLVRQAALEDFFVRYELLFTPDAPANRIALLGQLHANIQDRFHTAGVQIMSPHYLGDPAQAKIPARNA
ncbi:MAG: mechanosensitive ion channel [Verrucomicrobia bacterium]|nr:mechanosensitive ion channel [Verrucomicrobiota bacterium]